MAGASLRLAHYVPVYRLLRHEKLFGRLPLGGVTTPVPLLNLYSRKAAHARLQAAKSQIPVQN